MACEYAAGVGVDDEDEMAAGVEEDIVRCLRSDAVDGEEFRHATG